MDYNEKEIVPFIGTAKEMKQHISPLYIISDYMTDYDTYIEFKERIYKLIKGSFEIKECRTYPVKFKFYRKDTEIHTLELRHFLINLFLWYPFISLNDIEIMDKTFIFDCYNDIPIIDNYINDKIIDTLREYNVRTTIMNNDIAYTLYDLNRINIDFSLIMGLSMNTELFLDLYKNNAEYKDIMETKFDKSLQPHEIEGLLSEKQKRSIEILKNIKDNPLGVILRSGTGIKYKIKMYQNRVICWTNLFNCWELSYETISSQDLILIIK